MTRRDQELLDRQLRHLQIPERRDGALMLLMAGLFLAGLFLGDWHAAASEAQLPTQEIAVALQNGTAPATFLR